MGHTQKDEKPELEVIADVAEDEVCDTEGQYPAEHFFSCNWYSHKRKELEKLLEDGKAYSYAQVEDLLSKK